VRKIEVKVLEPGRASIEQLPATRGWMDESIEKHAYKCFPLTLTNRLGWGISFPEDIVFVWDGIDDTTPDHVKILKGHKYAHPNRGNATISFTTGLIFKTDDKTTLLTMPVPNQFIAGTQCFTSLISTSFYLPELPVAWKVTEANKEITIPAGTPIAAILPISLTSLQNEYELSVDSSPVDQEYMNKIYMYGEAAAAMAAGAAEGYGFKNWTNWYKKAVDYNNNPVGAHETKSIKLKTTGCPISGIGAQIDGDSVDEK
jgi:hypothetical protein